MDDYDAPAMKFGLEGDYDGGQFGEDGEFYASGERKGKTQSKRAAMYGVFDESSEDEDSKKRGKGKGGGGRKGAKPDYNGGVTFVSGGLKGEKSETWKDSDEEGGKRSDEEDEEEDDDEAAPRFGAGRKRTRPRHGGGGGSDGSDTERVAQRDPDAELPGEFGAKREAKKPEKRRVEQTKDEREAVARLSTINAGGMGLKMLQKMGYKGGGLGKEGTGITKAIEAKKRAAGEGLGNRPEHKQELKAEEPKEEKKKVKKVKKEFAWKVQLDDDRPRKPRKVYKTAEEIRTEAAEAGPEGKQAKPEAVNIVDMRGKSARLVRGEDIAKEVSDEDEDAAFTLPLVHNLAILIEAAEAEIFRVQKTVESDADAKVALEHERKEAQDRVDLQEYHMNRLEEVMAVIDRTYKRAVSKDSIPLDALADVFEQLRTNYKAEYQMYNLSALAGPLVVPPMKHFLASWDPTRDPRGPAQAMRAWRGLLRTADEDAVTMADAPAFLQLVDEVLMPKILAASGAPWEPKRGAEGMVALMEAWEDVLPHKHREMLLSSSVVPKLLVAVNSWDPKVDPIPVHEWLHPWLPFIPDQLEQLYPTLRYKIGVALAHWHPSDPSAHSILSPWTKVFKPLHMEALLVRCVLPKVAVTLREMAINPAAQSLDPFNWTLLWLGTASGEHIASIFEAEFFPRWLQVLYQWLTARPDYEEVTRWYLNWKALFPAELAAVESVKRNFTRALDMMNAVVAGQKVQGVYVQPGAAESLSYLRVNEQREEKEGERGGGAAPAPRAKEKAKMSIVDAMYDSSVTFKEALEHLAEDNGLLLLPKAGKSQAGKQVYTLGKVSVYLDNRLVYASEAGVWKPMALDDLLKKAQK